MNKYRLASQYHDYRRYEAGGTMSTGQQWSAVGTSARTAAGIIDSVYTQNDFGARPLGASIGSGALQGASLGSAGGPWGAAIGAVVGAGYGFFSGKAQNSKAGRLETQFHGQQDQQQRALSNAAIAQNPALAQGTAGASYYAMGGRIVRTSSPDESAEYMTMKSSQIGAKSKSRPLSENYLTRSTKVEGGSLTPMSDDSVAINGPSHAQGGVQLPDQGAEVEGGETMKGNFVFSDRLGFADEHKRIAGAIGKIQSKGVMSPDRVNSIRRLQDREQKLALSQEYLKHILSDGAHPDPTQPQTAAA